MQKHFLLSLLLLTGAASTHAQVQPVHKDKPYLQDLSIKYYADTTQSSLQQVAADRNGIIQMLAKEGLRHTSAGQFLYPGKVVPDRNYRYMKDKRISNLISYENQLVYLTDQVVFSNAWAGTLFSKHNLPKASLLAGGKDFTFLVSDGASLELIKDSKSLWNGK